MYHIIQIYIILFYFSEADSEIPKVIEEKEVLLKEFEENHEDKHEGKENINADKMCVTYLLSSIDIFLFFYYLYNDIVY